MGWEFFPLDPYSLAAKDFSNSLQKTSPAVRLAPISVNHVYRECNIYGG